MKVFITLKKNLLNIAEVSKHRVKILVFSIALLIVLYLYLSEAPIISLVSKVVLEGIWEAELDIALKEKELLIGMASVIGLGLLLYRSVAVSKQLRYQGQQLENQISQRIDDRFNTAINTLGSNESSARTGAAYSLYYLAIENKKYTGSIVEILCSHIRSKTQEPDYQKTTASDHPMKFRQSLICYLLKRATRS